ncbi:hypothetical protein [Halopiger djelfimassiliensis]|uniref:hypothetical protein n=1 Tax=Halopiger djelfimassiliensis TaxID=1293047 RepID=UPI000677D7C3|nr:hypothetical protein [Halopiger djelfimassiliensis]
MTITFEETTHPAGLEVYDSLEQRHLQVKTDGVVSSVTDEPEGFRFPVNKTCTIETDELYFDRLFSVTLHDRTGRSEANFDVGETVALDERTQFVGLSGPIKLYCRTETAGTVDIGLTSIRITLERESTIELGARSLHDRPAGTITTPPDVESMMDAISVLPSALKTTSPERTWPTLRGHPPLIELGERLEVPDSIDRPDNDHGITVTVPPEYLPLYQAAPLAFFLGATIRPGPEPKLETPQFEYTLADTRSFGDDIARLLKRFFFLDCLVRNEGFFQYDLLELSVLEDELPFALGSMYETPLPARLERYLEIPYEVIDSHAPRWPLTAHVPDDPESIELIPFVVNELGLVREATGTVADAVSSADPSNAQLVRSAAATRSPPSVTGDSEFVVPTVTDESVEHAWFGDAVPQNASKATIEAYRNQLDRGARSESIEILLVCNDARMIDEHDLLDEAYGTREELPFEIRSEFGVSSDRLASLLSEGGYDFVHYIGHATEDGLRCPDADLDVRSLESVDVGVFFLNACRSYEQGIALTRRGAFGGVSTYGDVANEDAVEAGETMARLLNRGFPLRGALEIAQQNSSLGDQYLIVGDGSVDIAQTDHGAPGIIELERRNEDEFGFSIRSYSTKEFKLGSVTESNLKSVADRHLTPGFTPFSGVEADSIQEYLIWIELPILIDDQLHWNDGVGPAII